MENSTSDATPSTTTLPRSSDFDVDPPSFAPATWINNVLSGPSPPDLSTLDDALSDALRESHESLDTALQNALKAVPWVVRESERVRQRANSLRLNVDGVGERVAGVETSVVSSVNTIADADTIVRRVQETATLLETAANSELLLERLQSLLASAGADGADLVAAADVVSQLRSALRPLHGVPEMKDRFAQLEKADASLEKLAAPQLLKALEARNRQAAVNARIVFDHAGRENAFCAQYVSLRGNQVRQIWSHAWGKSQPLPPHPVPVHSTSRSVAPPTSTGSSNSGDLAANGAVVPLRSFYDELSSLVVTEAAWLQETFPDLKSILLPALVCDSLKELKEPAPRANVIVPSNVSDPVGAADSLAERLFTVSQSSVQATARIGKILLPPDLVEEADEGEPVTVEETPDEDSKHSQEELLSTIVDAMTAMLMPYRLFWDHLQQVAIKQARARAEAVTLRVSPTTSTATTAMKDGKPAIQQRRPPLADIAKDVDTCTREISSILDLCLNDVNSKSCGIGIDAMKQVSVAVSSVFSDRLLKVLRFPESVGGEDEWTHLSGALSLLIATSALKRSMDARKESSFAVAVGTATPVLEVSSVLQDRPSERIQQFLAQVETGNLSEAGVVWELVRDQRLSQQVVSRFESLDSANDFQTLVDTVHGLVYDIMFNGIIERFSSFSNRDPWSSEGGDNDSSMLGFSSSPLRYATEVADYLITIPQQLEPFVPDEDDEKYATPTSLYAFSKSSRKRVNKVTTRSEGEDNVEEEVNNMSFAGMWISVLAVGTMKLYVEKICSIIKLTESGSHQLATDAGYILSVMGSLGVSATPEMELICRLLESKSDTVSFTEAGVGYDSPDHRKLIRQVAAIRGINVTI